MNLNKKIPAAIALASCLLLPSCDFNEDFCTRYGELIAYCDWENITEKAPLPPLRHVIPFQGNASIQEAKTFTQDTLRWQLPRGDYRFVFYTGDYQVNRLDDYYECNLSVPTDTVNGKAYITAVQKYCCSSAFNEKLGSWIGANGHRLVYGGSRSGLMGQLAQSALDAGGTVTGVEPQFFIDEGYELDGLSTSRYLVSREKSGSAILPGEFKKEGSTWNSSFYLFGVYPDTDNILTVKVEMDNDNEIFNEIRTIDLSQHLRPLNDDEITLEIDFEVGKGMKVETVTITDWIDCPETELQ